MQVLDYDESDEKFLVKVMATGLQKWVIRLSLLFNHEDPVKHMARIDLAKSRMRTAEDETRFLQFIDGMPLDASAKLLPNWRKEIVNFTYRRAPNAPEERIGDFDEAKLVKDLLNELEIDYIRQIKKGILLREMQYNSDVYAWRDARIQNRYVAPIIPEIGTVCSVDYTLAFTR